MADVKLVALKRQVNRGELVEEGDEFTVDESSVDALLDEDQEGGPIAAKPGTKAAKSAESDQPNASRSARKAAKDLDVDLSTVNGTGKDGAITVKDVKDAAGT